jgi:hypothetical protein
MVNPFLRLYLVPTAPLIPIILIYILDKIEI